MSGASVRGTRRRASTPARRVLVVGAGRMGADIALAFALAGWRCDVVETDDTVRARVPAYWDAELARMRARSARRRLALHAELDAVADPAHLDLAIEAVHEDLRLKHRLMKALEARVGAATIIATNTSSLAIGAVTRPLRRPQRAAGLHFMIPAHVMLAVEITRGAKTSPATMDALVRWTSEMGKVPVVLNRDVPGMIINRIQHAMYREIYHLIDSGVASAEDIDRAVRFGFGFRYPILGPVISRDIHGLPVHLATARQLLPTLHNGKRPSRTLERLVDAGHHGVRSGQGFYAWDRATADARLAKFAELLERAVRRIERRGEPIGF